MAMIKKLLFTLFLCVLAGGGLYAQSTIKGEVKDPSGNPVSYLQLYLKQEDRVVNGAMTDDRGSYSIFGVSAGTYDITAGGTMNCLSTHTEKGIYVSNSEVKFVNLTVNCSTELENVEVVYVPPIFSQDNTTSSQKLTGDEVRKTPGRSITAALSNLAGVASVDGNVASVRGNRSGGQQTIIDGVRVRGNSGVTMQSLEGFELIQGGIPAEYGDGTSFTVITTRGVSKDFHGGAELRASLEGYGQTLAAANISGPILKGKHPQDPPRMGFLLSAEGSYNIDDRPARGGTWVAKPDVIKNVIANPVDFRYESGVFIPYYNANELGKDDFKKIRVRQNAQDWGILAQGKIDIMGGGKDARGRAKNNLRFTLGGTYEYTSQRDWGSGNALFNSKNNADYNRNTLRVFARINHRVKTDTAANALLKNVMYDINVNYTLYNVKVEDRNHRDNLFAYGYIGKFNTTRQDLYSYNTMWLYNPEKDTTEMYFVPTRLLYQAADYVTFDADYYLNNGNYYNPDLIPYTQNFYDFLMEKTGGNRDKIREIFDSNLDYNLYHQFYALLNGASPSLVANNLFYAPGVINSNVYQKARTETIAARANLSLNIQDHEVKFGFEFEKRTDRSYSVNATGLWGRMRELTYDASYFPFDFSDSYWTSGDTAPRFINYGGYYIVDDTLMYEILDRTTHFDNNLRNLLKGKGYVIGDKQFLDIDSYDPTFYSLDLFSNYELLNTGNPLVSYSGYDYTGKISNKKINLENFFGKDDLHAKNKYAIGAFEPVYVAFYLQDKFAISNLLFSLGLRVDYFNANQKVLKDPFLLRSAYTVGELKGSANTPWPNYNFPDNVGADWVPYISAADNDIITAPNSQGAIVAYRNGKTWFNSLGQEIADPASFLGASSGPILKNALDPEAPSKASSDAFVNYKPQWNVMPRISFSFPVSTNSLFYAHYNITTNRPTRLQIEPVKYLFIASYNTDSRIINNPNLKAERNVDYEIGFRQKVGENTALNFCAYYSEKRDQIQSYRLTGAYPNTYYSYENMDFGTVQGFSLEITMRGAKNLSFRAGYTISFAKGTGSSEQSNLAIIASGQPNLRTLTNLEFDQRHRVTASIDFRFDGGTNYNGPVTVKQKKGTDTKKEIRWFENAGVSLIFAAASGMPYSRSGIVYSTLRWGESIKPQLKGSINGANMPWTFRCDLRIDKSFTFNLASNKNKNESGKRNNKPGMLTVYLDFQNILNLKNVQSVYDYTGSADDDGYLSSSLFKSYVEKGNAFGLNPDAAANYYQMAISNPYNYTQPFRVYLGVIFSF